MAFDTHAHLADERFHEDRDAVIERATAASVSGIVCVATTADDSVRCVEIAAKYPTVWASAGLQPNTIAESKPGDWDRVGALAQQPRVIAIGETGLDRHWDFTPFPHQEDFFRRHLALSRETRHPVIIHCREAEADVVRMLRDEFDRAGPIEGIMHSFTGDWPTAEACLAMGLFISFAGMITYKSAATLRAVAARIPPERLLLETDCPYLAPTPVRGQRNEPAYLVHTASCLAGERGIPADDLLALTARNARQLFGLAG